MESKTHTSVTLYLAPAFQQICELARSKRRVFTDENFKGGEKENNDSGTIDSFFSPPPYRIYFSACHRIVMKRLYNSSGPTASFHRQENRHRWKRRFSKAVRGTGGRADTKCKPPGLALSSSHGDLLSLCLSVCLYCPLFPSLSGSTLNKHRSSPAA